jgi:hypothetical protein
MFRFFNGTKITDQNVQIYLRCLAVFVLYIRRRLRRQVQAEAEGTIYYLDLTVGQAES